MNDERWKSILSFIQFVLGTVVLGLFAAYINHQIQTREVEIKEQELIAKNLPTVLGNNSADNLRMAQFYATVTRSREIRERWIEYRGELKKDIELAKAEAARITSTITQATDAKEADQKQAQVQQITATITPGIKADSPVPVQPRLYFHIQSEAQREKAANVGAMLAKESGVLIPGVQLRTTAPNVSEIRYFKPADSIDAEKYARELKGLGLPITAKYVPGYESSDKLRAKHFEVWIAGSWGGN